MREAVWICVPTYNEAQNVESHLAAVVAVLDERSIDGRILVIDDNSPDGTATLARTFAAREPRVQVLERPAKEGIGPAYRAGFTAALAAGAAVVVEMDCDGSHDPRDLPRLLAPLGEADLVIGSRYVAGGRCDEWGLARRVLSRGGCWYARRMLAVPVRDLTGGYKAFTRAAVERCVLGHGGVSGFGFQIETTVRVIRAGMRVVEVPITFRERTLGSSKMSRGIAVEAAVLVAQMRRDGLHEPVVVPTPPAVEQPTVVEPDLTS